MSMKIDNQDLIVVVMFFLLIGTIIYAAITKNNSNTPQTQKTENGLSSSEKLDLNNSNETNTVEKSEPAPATINDIVTKNMSSNDKQLTPKPTQNYLEAGKTYTAVLNTNAGVIKIKLNADKTPITANNFVYLSKLGFYNNVIFHRVMKEFMIQSGDPIGDGTGGPAYKFDDEKFEGEYKRGVVAMANAGPNTNGSQFFIMHADVPLQKAYVIFGEVTEGMDVVDKIATAEVTAGLSGENSTPKKPVIINTVDIEVQ